MRKIKLECVLEFGSRAAFAIIDVTEVPHKKRGTISIDYSRSDLKQLQEHALTSLSAPNVSDTDLSAEHDFDIDVAMKYYEEQIYSLVRHYISGDWEDAGGYDAALEIIKKHIKPLFDKQ